MSEIPTTCEVQSDDAELRGVVDNCESGGAIAYIPSMFPLRSETFVYREVRELRRRGWNVLAVSLHRPPEPELPECADLGRPLILYSHAMPFNAAKELVLHPLRAARTFFLTMEDSLLPGEPLNVRGRGKLFGQVVASLALARLLRRAKGQHLHCHFAYTPTTGRKFAARHLRI